jgi:hypothetical protein
MEASCSGTARRVGLALAVALWAASARAFSEPSTEAVRGFLSGLPVSEGAKRALEAKVRAGGGASDWIATVDATVFGLVAISVPGDSDARMRQALEQASVKRAVGRASNLLFVHAAGERYVDVAYRNRDAVADALIACEASMSLEGRLSPGVQSQGAMVGGYAVAIAYAGADKVNLYSAHLPTDDALRPFYCRALYAIARSLMSQGKFGEALPLLRDLHGLKWDRPEVYLDTARCFLKNGQAEDARPILEGILDRFGPALTSEQAELAGNLMLEAGIAAEAKRAFELSLQRLHEENSRQNGPPGN